MIGVDVPSSRDPVVPAIEGVNWVVRPREFWVVGGLVASGKTDLCLTAAGVHPPLRGTLRAFGCRFNGAYAENQLRERLRLGLVHDGGLLLRHLSVAENIALPLRYHHDATPEEVAPRLSGWIEATGLRSQADRASGAVNRNWAQRAGLARACILEPELLVLDNPLTGLDPHHVRWWLEMLPALARGHPLLTHRPMTLIVTCDDFRPWLAPGRRFAVLRQRRLEILDPALDPDQLARILVEEAA
jgi:ABC-type transporter Mla maintaining outer membrane lipid asymmetry ATPase subunit MlaF